MEAVLKRDVDGQSQEVFVHIGGSPNACDLIADAARATGFSVIPRRCPATVGMERVVTTVDNDHKIHLYATIVFFFGDGNPSYDAMTDVCDQIGNRGYGWMTRIEWDRRISRVSGET